jgi:hypothetical protein
MKATDPNFKKTDNCPTTMYTQFCTEFEENPTDGLVADTTSKRDRDREGNVFHIRHSPFLLGKERLSKLD